MIDEDFKKAIPITTIRCSQNTKDRLIKLDIAKKGISYEQIINTLADEYEKKNQRD